MTGLPSFAQALDRIVRSIKEMEPVVLARFHDGEFRVCTGKPYKSAAGWTSTKNPWLRERLLEALRYKADGYTVGISPPCCASSATNYYSREVQAAKTFATVFHNANYRRARVALKEVDAVFVGDVPSATVRIPSNGVEKVWNLDEIVGRLMDGPKDKPIFLAAGPVSCVLAHKLRVSGVRVPVVDVGALFDDRRPRRYKAANETSRHVCAWTLPEARPLKRVGGYTPPSRTPSVRRVKYQP